MIKRTKLNSAGSPVVRHGEGNGGECVRLPANKSGVLAMCECCKNSNNVPSLEVRDGGSHVEVDELGGTNGEGAGVEDRECASNDDERQRTKLE